MALSGTGKQINTDMARLLSDGAEPDFECLGLEKPAKTAHK